MNTLRNNAEKNSSKLKSVHAEKSMIFPVICGFAFVGEKCGSDESEF
jgi:hypothetical protein